jgi:hypothetical protein
MNTNTMPNNILVGSEKLFRTKAPWRISNSLYGEMTKDHSCILFNYNLNVLSPTKVAKHIGRHIYDKAQHPYEKITFIGIGRDTEILYKLNELGFVFDAAVLVNHEMNPKMFEAGFERTAIYNFCTKVHEYKDSIIQGAECNEYVRTYVPAHMSNRLAKEIFGNVVYQSYEVNYLNDVVPTFKYLEDIPA